MSQSHEQRGLLLDGGDWQGWGVYRMGGPSRTKVPSQKVTVSGRALVFCTELACVHLGLLAGPRRPEANVEAAERWGRDPLRFIAAVRRQHLRGAAAERTLTAWPAPVIGWAPRQPSPQDSWQTMVCTDLAWTIAVLARVDGTLLLPRRRARLTWERLFGEPFALDDPRLHAVAGVPRDHIGAIGEPVAAPAATLAAIATFGATP